MINIKEKFEQLQRYQPGTGYDDSDSYTEMQDNEYGDYLSYEDVKKLIKQIQIKIRNEHKRKYKK